MPPVRGLRSIQSPAHTEHRGNYTSRACFACQQRRTKCEVEVAQDGKGRDCRRCVAAGIECLWAGKAASPVLLPVDVCTEGMGYEKATVETVTPKDGGVTLRAKELEECDNSVRIACPVPRRSAADGGFTGVKLRRPERMNSTPLRFGSRSAIPTVCCAPKDFTQPPVSPLHQSSNSGPRRPLAHSLFDEHDLEVVRRIITQDKRVPFRDLAQGRFLNQAAYVRVQKPLPLPGGPPSAPFEGKSNGARKRRLRREALAAQRLAEGGL